MSSPRDIKHVSSMLEEVHLLDTLEKAYLTNEEKADYKKMYRHMERIRADIGSSIGTFQMRPRIGGIYPKEELEASLEDALREAKVLYYDILRMYRGIATKDIDISSFDKPLEVVVMDELSFEVEEKDSYTVIRMNDALPNVRTIADSLAKYKRRLEDAFKSFLGERRVRKMKEVYMVFVHHYDASRTYCKRDADNYYEKALSDVIAETFLFGGDDSSGNVQRCSFTFADNRSFTEVHLIPYENFLAWLSEHPINP